MSAQNGQVSVSLDYETGTVNILNGLVRSFIQSLVDLDNIVPLKSFDFSADEGVDDAFEYKIKSLDGRVWKQILTFDDVNDPLQTFHVPDGWRLSEFAYHRVVRDNVVKLYQMYRVTRIKATF